MAPLKVDCTSGLVIEILYYLNQVRWRYFYQSPKRPYFHEKVYLSPTVGILYKYANPIHSLLRRKDDNAGQKPWAGGGGKGALRFD